MSNVTLDTPILTSDRLERIRQDPFGPMSKTEAEQALQLLQMHSRQNLDQITRLQTANRQNDAVMIELNNRLAAAPLKMTEAEYEAAFEAQAD